MRQFHAEEAAADDHHILNPGHCRADAARVFHGAQRNDAVEFQAGKLGHPCPRAHCQNEVGELQFASARQNQPLSARVDPLGAGAKFEFHGIVAVDGLGAQHQTFRIRRFQVGLRQRGPVIGQVSFVADQHDLAGISFLTQADRGLRAAMPGTDDDASLDHKPSTGGPRRSDLRQGTFHPARSARKPRASLPRPGREIFRCIFPEKFKQLV
jgi:hypothetical protein